MRNNNREVIKMIAARQYQSNRGRNTILIAATALAVVMIFCIFSITSGKINADYLLYMRSSGTAASTTLEQADEKQYEQIKNLPYIKEVGKETAFGVSDKFLCSVLDKSAWENIQVPAYTDICGVYPEKADDIMMSVRALEAIGIKAPKLGMKITCPIYFDEGVSKEQTFYLCGYFTEYVDPVMSMPPAYFSQKYLDTLTTNIDDCTTLLIMQEDSISGESVEEMLYNDVTMRDDSQQFFGGNPMNMQAVTELAGGYDLAYIMAAVIFISALLLIFNVLHISLGHDVRQYGLLVTMGTTKKQLYRIVFRQTGKATVIGCAIGAAAGLVITLVILPGVLSDMYLHGLGSASAMISFNPYILILSLASGALAGFLSSALAIRKLAGISPVQSVKYTEKVHSHTTRSTGAGRFDIINMSWKNIFRFRGRFWLTVISLTLGLGISVTAIAVSHGIDTTNQISYEHHDFQIMSMIDTLTMDQYSKEYRFFPEDMAERMTKISGVEKVIKTTGGYGSISKKSKPFELRFSDEDNGKSYFVVQEVSKAYLAELKAFAEKENLYIDTDPVLKGTGALMLHYNVLSKVETEKSREYVGLPFTVYDTDGSRTCEMTFCGYLNFKKNGLPKLETTWNGRNIIYLLATDEGIRNMNIDTGIFLINLDVNEDKEPAVKNTLNHMVEQYNSQFTSGRSYGGIVTDSRILSLTAKSDLLAAAKDYINSSRIIMASLCIMLLFMGLINFVNVTATGLVLRKKEFAVMESIGMSKGQLKKMILSEGLLYSIFVILMTAVSGSIIWYITCHVIKSRLAYFRYYFPYIEFLAASLLLILICIIISHIAFKRCTADSITDRLKSFTD